MRRRGAAWAVFAVVALVLGGALPAACTIVTGLRATPPAADDHPSTCQHATYPSAPKEPAEGAEAKEDIVVAIRSVSMGVKDGDASIGYDLDGLCTCGGEGEGCAGNAAHCDDALGRDNQAQTLFRTLEGLQVLDIEGHINSFIALGQSTLLIKVQRYNGQPNDSEVVVSVLASTGLRRTLAEGGTDPEFVPPKFDVSDHWTIPRDQIAFPPEALIGKQVKTGYVADNVLVADHFDVTFDLLSGVAIALKDGVLTAQIEHGPSGSTITRGVLAGRWAVDSALAALGSIRNPETDLPFCETPGFAELVKQNLCAAADLSLVPKQPPGTPCDALSFALAYTAAPASLGAVLDIPSLPARCTGTVTLRCDR